MDDPRIEALTQAIREFEAANAISTTSGRSPDEDGDQGPSEDPPPGPEGIFYGIQGVTKAVSELLITISGSRVLYRVLSKVVATEADSELIERLIQALQPQARDTAEVFGHIRDVLAHMDERLSKIERTLRERLDDNES